MNTSGSRLRYGGPWFRTASALPINGGLGRPLALARLFVAIVVGPGKLVALVGLLLRSPKIEVELSNSNAGAFLARHFGQRFLGVFPQNRFCQGVLMLPEYPNDYLRGRHRRAVRNNLRHAAGADIRCENVASTSVALEAMRQVVLHRNAPITTADRVGLKEHWPRVFAQPEVTTFVARGTGDRALAVTAVVTDEHASLIVLAVACSHEARWALHHHLVQVLIARHVKYLLAADGGPFGALGLPPDVQYYQHLLGYDLCHVIPRLGATSRPCTETQHGTARSGSEAHIRGPVCALTPVRRGLK